MSYGHPHDMPFTIHNRGNENEFITTSDYWDCECTNFYIHNKRIVKRCARCGAHSDEMPDSRVKEIIDCYKPEEGWA